jgi:hypothetical protein
MDIILIDLDESQYANIICRRLNHFEFGINFVTPLGAVVNISADTFEFTVFDSTGLSVLSFTMGSGCTIIDNKLYLTKTAAQMSLAAGEYTLGLKRTQVGGIEKTRMHGVFEVKAQYGE